MNQVEGGMEIGVEGGAARHGTARQGDESTQSQA